MTRQPDSVSHTKGKNKLRKHSDKIVTRTLKLINDIYQNAYETNNIADKRAALQLYLELFPYIRPKMMSIAPGELQEDGSISTQELDILNEIAEQYRLNYDPSKLLENKEESI